jgi:hypothetical protein
VHLDLLEAVREFLSSIELDRHETEDWPAGSKLALANLKQVYAHAQAVEDAFNSCPACGEDGGTLCGVPNCGLLTGNSRG